MKVSILRGGSNPSLQGGRPKEEILMSEVIKVVEAKQVRGFIFIFQIDHADNYNMLIDIKYTSEFFKKQLHHVFGREESIDLK